MRQAVEHSGVMDSTAVAQASQVASKVSEVVKEAAHTVQGAMSVVSLCAHLCITCRHECLYSTWLFCQCCRLPARHTGAWQQPLQLRSVRQHGWRAFMLLKGHC